MRHVPALFAWVVWVVSVGNAFALAACAPDVGFTPLQGFTTAVFDPATSRIPLPNDLVFFTPANSTCPPPDNALPAGSPPACAQAELIASFAGKFPSDQTVPITIDFAHTQRDAMSAPDLDLASFTRDTFFVYATAPSGSGEVEIDPLTADDYVKVGDHGTLTIHRRGLKPWAPGSYAVLVRGGPDGIKTADGSPVFASPVFALVAQAQDMTAPANIGLLKAQTGSTAAALAAGQQLNQLIAVYKTTAFPIADTRFPHEQLAVAATFDIAPRITTVTIDAERSEVPLPIDLLRDPVSGKLSPVAACALAGSTPAADGTCPNPAAAGFQALDGFSTTGAILAPTSELILAKTVTATTLQLYDLSDPLHPVQVDPATLILEPCEFTSGCAAANPLSPVIAIQPAGATSGDPSSVFRTRPLKDATDYAVIITTGVKDKAGNAIGPGTVATMLRFKSPLSNNGASAIAGVDDATATSLENMRLQLHPVFKALANRGVPAADVAVAYTFRTQTILSQAERLAALPYTLPAATALPNPSSFVAMPAATAFTKYGVDAVVPSANIDEILEVDIVTMNALDPATGAFIADPSKAKPETIHVLVATPKPSNPNVPACAGALAPYGKCAPMMVFHHGLGGGRADMLAVADSYAAAGMATVAIDSAKHGDRSFCTPGISNQCAGGAACTTDLPAGAQGDMHPPGTCGPAGFVKRPVSPRCTNSCASAAADGVAITSGNYLVTKNLFRIRDSLRQDLIDQAQLVRVLGFVPTGPPPTGHAVFDHMAARGAIIDPAVTYFSGQSLGAIQGAMDVATNPRIAKAALNAGGGTIVDVFANSPAFAPTMSALLGELGIAPGTASYLQFLTVAKTVLDPADPINFAGHLTANTLPNLLPPLGGNPNGSVAQAAKKLLTQMANCDLTVPNPFGLLAASTAATGPLPSTPTFFSPGATGTFQLFVTSPFDPASFGTCTPLPGSAVTHAFLTDWRVPSLTLNAQTDVGNFVMHDVAPRRIQH